MTENGVRLSDLTSRKFPDDAYMPGALNNVNPRRVEAVFLNILMGKKPKESPATKVLRMTLDRTVDGDANAKEAVEQLLNEVWFRPNQSTGTELLVTHVSLGKVFRPKSFYGVDKWCEAILAAGRVFAENEQRQQLVQIVEKAQARPMNLMEDAIFTALSKDQDIVETPVHFEYRPMAIPRIPEEICHLAKRLLNRAVGELSESDAERVLLDLVALLRTAMYVTYLQTHLSAARAMRADDRRGPVDDPPIDLYFGFETEATEPTGRQFFQTRDLLKRDLENGHYAIIALSIAHQVFNWKKAHWFNNLPVGLLKPKDLDALHEWHEESLGAFEGGSDLWTPPVDINNYADAVWSIYSSIANNTRRLRTDPASRPAFKKTFGILGSFALAEDGAIFKKLGSLGSHAMIDTEMVLLLARIMATKMGQTPLAHIFYQLESIGIKLDDDSQEAAIYELERIGRLQRLSDSGESIYVRAD
jgi:hypothetical protein